MRELLSGKLKKFLLLVVVGIAACVMSTYFLFFRAEQKPLAPSVPVVSDCKELTPGMMRIGNRYGVQFDVPAKDFTMGEGWSDAAPLVGGFDLSPKNRQGHLSIWLRRPPEKMAVDPVRVFSAHAEKRTIFDDQGRTIGEDYWGYLSSGERWRRVEFRGMVAAEYGLTNGTEAKLFDHVISSACILPAPTP